MLDLQSLSCTLRALVASAVLWQIMDNGTLAQALNFTDRRSWNISGLLLNETRHSSPTSNTTGLDVGSHSNVSLSESLWPPVSSYNNFSEQCLLWDDQCIGNRTEALDSFFNNSGTLYNVVYGAHCIWSRVPQCAPWLPSPVVLPKLLEWLRQPECIQSFDAYHTQHTDEPPWTYSRRSFDGWNILTIDWDTIATTTSTIGCCNQCTIFGGNVDVYYWPVLGANSACLSVIGSSFKNPATELLVTDDRGYPYWKPQRNPWADNNSQNVNSITIPAEQAFPEGGVNPLSAPTYIVQARGYRYSNTTLAANISSVEAIATIGNFRCTSPSVCVGFSNIYAADGCGVLSTDGGLITYTVIAFAPGELSTIQTPAWLRASDLPKAAIKAFNFGDLPCPPQSVMYDVEYKPALGEPYRPVLSAPSRLSSLLPEWSKSGCVISAALFNGVDPPIALHPAEVLTPRITQAIPSASVTPVAAPASGIRASEPKKTLDPARIGDVDPSTPPDTETRESGPEFPDPSGTGSNHASLEVEVPKVPGSETFDTDTSVPKVVGSQDTSTATPSSEKGAAEASKPKPRPETLDPEHATSQPYDPEDAEPPGSDGYYDPGERPRSTSGAFKKDDPKVETTNPNQFLPNSPTDSPLNIADTSNQKYKSLPPASSMNYPSYSNMEDGPGLASQEPKVASSGKANADSLNDQKSSKGGDAAKPYPKNAPAAEPGASGDEKSDVDDTYSDNNLFRLPHGKLFSTNEAQPLSAKSGDGKVSTLDGPGLGPSYRPKNLDSGQPGLYPSEETLKDALTLHYSNGAVPDKSLNAMAGVPSMTVSGDDSTLSPQHSSSILSPGDIIVVKLSTSKPSTTDASASPTITVSTSNTLNAVSSSASGAAAGLRLSGGELSDNESQGKNGSSPSETRSSGTTRSASTRHTKSSILTSTQELLLGFCVIYVLPWLLKLL